MKTLKDFINETLSFEQKWSKESLIDALKKYNDKLPKKYVPVLVGDKLNKYWYLLATDKYAWTYDNQNKRTDEGCWEELQNEFYKDGAFYTNGPKEMDFTKYSNIEELEELKDFDLDGFVDAFLKEDNIEYFDFDYSSWDNVLKNLLPKYLTKDIKRIFQ